MDCSVRRVDSKKVIGGYVQVVVPIRGPPRQEHHGDSLRILGITWRVKQYDVSSGILLV